MLSPPPPRGFKRALRAALGARAHRALRQLQWAVRTDLGDRRHSWPERLWAWRRGFTADSAALYEFPREDWRDYLSDYAREVLAQWINPVPHIFDHKLMLRAFLLRHGFAQAETVALIGCADAQLDPLGASSRLVSHAEVERSLLEDGGHFIVKPEDGAYGEGVAKVEAQSGALVRRRGRDVTPFQVTPGKSTTLVERAIPQHEAWARFCPEAWNTLRVLTLWTPGDPAPFIAAAAQRIGAGDTAPTDSFGGGGAAAPIDLTTGVLGQACRRTPSGRPERLTRHAETGAPIEGVRLPFWDAICGTALAAASRLGVARCVGWDILVNAQGTPVILEGNANTGVHILQLGGGLLKRPEVRRFYETYGVL